VKVDSDFGMEKSQLRLSRVHKSFLGSTRQATSEDEDAVEETLAIQVVNEGRNRQRGDKAALSFHSKFIIVTERKVVRL
jgi:hypothetical protein